MKRLSIESNDTGECWYEYGDIDSAQAAYPECTVIEVDDGVELVDEPQGLINGMVSVYLRSGG